MKPDRGTDDRAAGVEQVWTDEWLAQQAAACNIVVVTSGEPIEIGGEVLKLIRAYRFAREKVEASFTTQPEKDEGAP